jgi:hypothetical protein
LYHGGEYSDTHTSPCIAEIVDFKSADVLYHFSKKGDESNRKVSTEVYDEYMTWILGYNLKYPSPWRSLWTGWPEEIKIGRTDIRSFDFIKNYGFIFPTLDVPGNLLGSFLTVFRYCGEFPDKINWWSELVKHGCNPAFALMLTGILDVKGVVNPQYNSNHWFLNTSKFDVPCLQNLVEGKPAGVTEAFSETGRYKGITDLWGNSDYRQTVSSLLKAKAPKTEKLDRFGHISVTSGRIEDPIKTALKFQEELIG